MDTSLPNVETAKQATTAKGNRRIKPSPIKAPDEFDANLRQSNSDAQRHAGYEEQLTAATDALKDALVQEFAELKQLIIERLTPPNSAERDNTAGTADPHAPYFSASWFTTKYGIPYDRLRAARRDGRLEAVKNGRRYHYSVADAQRIWPEDGIEKDG